MERDEVCVPKTHEDLGIPDEEPKKTINYEELLGDTLYIVLFRPSLASKPQLLNIKMQKKRKLT